MHKIFVTFLFILITLSLSCGKRNDSNKINSVSNVLGGRSDSGFLKVTEPRKFIFPDDNGPHPGYKTEWWYFTGNLITAEGKNFGYQFTIFRNALTPEKTESESHWRSDDIYMAHFTISDIDNGKFYFSEKFSREGNKLAGANANPFKIWLENWYVRETGASNQKDFPKVLLFAESNNIKIELNLEPSKPIVLQGDNGISQKGKEPGNASYYYSVTKLFSEGSVIIDGNKSPVSGYSWLDREWSTSALSSEQKGWDWFSLQLDNNYEIMYYQLRRIDGSADKFSKGTIIDPKGEKKIVNLDDVRLQILGEWKNKNDKAYSSGWKLNILSQNIELSIIPAIMDQELDVSLKYWEGSVNIKGTFDGKPINGRGYVELTGYAD